MLRAHAVSTLVRRRLGSDSYFTTSVPGIGTASTHFLFALSTCSARTSFCCHRIVKHYRSVSAQPSMAEDRGRHLVTGSQMSDYAYTLLD